MTKITYQIVEHDGGWAYKVDGVFSETFPSHDLARKAAERAAREQHVPGETRTISWEDANGRWHEELSAAPIGRKPTSRAKAKPLRYFPPLLPRDIGPSRPSLNGTMARRRERVCIRRLGIEADERSIFADGAHCAQRL